jgi:HEAT repeat protein
VKWGESAAVFAAWGAWRATGSRRAGAVLSEALASDDETNRTAAGILLVRSARRALPLLRENLARGVAVPMTLRLLGDIGGAEASAAIEPFAKSADPAVARAAAEALQAAGQNRRGKEAS